MLHSNACSCFISVSIGDHQSFICVAAILQLPMPTPPLSSILWNERNHREWKHHPVFSPFGIGGHFKLTAHLTA